MLLLNNQYCATTFKSTLQLSTAHFPTIVISEHNIYHTIVNSAILKPDTFWRLWYALAKYQHCKHQHFTNINILQTSTFYKHQHFTLSINILQTSTFYKYQHITSINILQTSTFYKHQHFTNINITNINISNINIANINIAASTFIISKTKNLSLLKFFNIHCCVL